MRNVFTADSPAQAHIVAGLLEDEGIRCVVEGEMLFGVRGDLGLTASSLPSVAVNDEDAARAIEVISARERDVEAEAVEADPDAAPRPPRLRHAAMIVVLWTLIAAVVGSATGPIAIPFVVTACFIHLYLHLDRAS